MPPHLVPYGYLTGAPDNKATGKPHALDVQQRVPGRENLTEQELSSRLLEINQQKQFENEESNIILIEPVPASVQPCYKKLIKPLDYDILSKYLALKCLEILEASFLSCSFFLI